MVVELAWVLEWSYGFDRSLVAEELSALAESVGIRFEEREDVGTVDTVDAAQYQSITIGEPVRVDSPEMPRRYEAAASVRHADRDEPPRLETTPVLGNLVATDVARPGVDILKQVAVDRFQVVKVETHAGADSRMRCATAARSAASSAGASRISSLLPRTV